MISPFFRSDSLRQVSKKAAARQRRRLLVQSLESRQLLAADPIISEFVASNDSTIQDDNGAFSDWIEIYNAGDTAADLTGYTLTDNPASIAKFTFPATTLDPGAFLVVFANDDADPASGTDLYTEFKLSSGGEFVGLYDNTGTLLSGFNADGSDYPAQQTDVSFGYAFDPVVIPQPVVIIGNGSSGGNATENNGSFEDTDPSTNPSGSGGSTRWAANPGQTATIDGWSVLGQRGFVGWDDGSGGASDGSIYAFLNNNSAATFQSDPIAVDLVEGESLSLKFDTTSNLTGGAVSYSVTLLIGTGGNSTTSNFTHVGTASSFDPQSFRHVINAAQAGSNTVAVQITVDNPSGVNDQPKFDNVRLAQGLFQNPQSLENFDGVTAPSLPAGWTATSNQSNLWSTQNGAAFSGDNGASVIGVNGSDSHLTSPPFLVTADTAQIRFQHNYNHEYKFDGGVLEIAIAGGSFQDILDAGGAFVEGGYDTTLFTDFSNVLEGRPAWTGNSSGFITSEVELPSSAYDQDVQLRWRLANDRDQISGGWAIDSIEQLALLPGGPFLPQLREPRQFGFLLEPTPGFANSDLQASQVSFSQPGGLFTGTIAVSLSSEVSGEEIRYSLDGSVPTATSTLYSGPISISGTTEVRAVAVNASGLSGTVTGETYVQNQLGGDFAGFSSNLPVLVLDNFGAGNPLNKNYNTTFLSAYEPDPTTGLTTFDGPASVTNRAATHRRGSSSLTFGKNNFRLETRDQTGEDTNVSLFGLPSESDYVLSTFARFDRAHIRNPLAFDTNRQAGVYAPRTRYVEVFFNQNGGPLTEADYFGVYALTENIKRDAERVDIVKIESTDNSGEAVTGGYIIKIDRADPDEVSFKTDRNFPSASRIVIDEPSSPTTQQENYIQDYVQDFEDALFGANFENSAGLSYDEFIDVDSFVDQHIFHLFFKDPDSQRFSSYFHKDRGGKLTAGPNWDQERIAGVETDTSTNRARNPENWNGDGSSPDQFNTDWYDRLFEDPDFMQRWVDRFEELRGAVYNDASIDALIDGYVAQLTGTNAGGDPLSSPIVRNFVRWGEDAGNGSNGNNNNGAEAWPNDRSDGSFEYANPSITAGISQPNASNATSENILAHWRSEVDHVRNWTKLRMTWVFDQLSGLAGFSQAPGVVAPGAQVNLVLPAGSAVSAQVYYTTDGSDPRASGGAASTSATLWDGNPITINDTTQVTVRVLDATVDNPKNQVLGQANTFDIWSAPSTALFEVGASVQDSLVISEINYQPYEPTQAEIDTIQNGDTTIVVSNDDFEFIEIMNTSTTESINLAQTKFSNGVSFTFGNDVLAPGERAVVVEDAAAFPVRYVTSIRVLGQWGGGLSGGGERIEVIDNTGVEAFNINYADSDPWNVAADGAGGTLNLIDPVGTPREELGKPYRWTANSEYGGSPGTAATASRGVVINEVVAHTDLGNVPGVDTIELFNPTGSPINIAGWWLSDGSSDPIRPLYQIPLSTPALTAGSYIIFDEDDFNPTPAGPGPDDFALSSSGGDQIYLTQAIGGEITQFEDVVEFGATFNSQALGRSADGSGRLVPMVNPSLGVINGAFEFFDVIISEVNYHPANPNDAALMIDGLLTDNDLEFIEISNTGNTTESLENWRLRGISDYDFTPTRSLGAGETLVAVTFDPTVDTIKRDAFRAHYGIDSSVTLVGPLNASLSNSHGVVKLQRPDSPPAGSLVNPNVLTDEVFYDDLSPWAITADGDGDSLNRIAASTLGNFAASWTGAAPTPGAYTESAAPSVERITVNNNRDTRSEVTSITVEFDSLVNASSSSFQLRNTATNTLVSGVSVSFGPVANKTVATLTFTSGPQVIASNASGVAATLANGNYELTVIGSNVTSQSSGSPMNGDVNTTSSDNLFRKYGDDDGGDSVGLADFAAFRSVFGTSVASDGLNFDSSLDSNRDGQISLTDFAAFRAGFGM